MELFLEVEAEVADRMEIVASGRDIEKVGALEGNTMLGTYRELAPRGPNLKLTVRNEIPLGMGCGSSAAALLAGVELANHFGALGMTRDAVLAEACRREGHPDNVAACFLGGFTVSAMVDGLVQTATFPGGTGWRLLLVMPKTSLATSEARALLPESYAKADVVANLQATALLVAAFAQDRPELLAVATRDRVHQPYRMEACRLLPLLLPLVGRDGIYAVTLSGAGPSVLVVANGVVPGQILRQAVMTACADSTVEVVETRVFVLAPELPSGMVT